MYDLLKDLRIVEGSAFVAAPLGGMTLVHWVRRSYALTLLVVDWITGAGR